MYAQHAPDVHVYGQGSPLPSFDGDGFLRDPNLWTEEMGRSIARMYGIDTITERHWRVIHHLRDRYFRVGGLPAMRLLCRATSLSREEIYGLFGGCCTAWRIAGLPDPGEEARAYFG